MEYSLIINGHVFEFKPGQTILEVADTHNIQIPTLCHLKGLTPTGSCRICVVEVERARRLLYAGRNGHGRKNRYQVKTNQFSNIPSPYLPEMKNPLIVRDFSRCILFGNRRPQMSPHNCPFNPHLIR
ncbi:MAG: 2Fe-2S iron-sulfur cluster-binding protein [Desulfatirhabdiaceae bacterium]